MAGISHESKPEHTETRITPIVDGLVHISAIGDLAIVNSLRTRLAPDVKVEKEHDIKGFQLTLRPSTPDLSIEYSCRFTSIGETAWFGEGKFHGQRDGLLFFVRLSVSIDFLTYISSCLNHFSG